MRGALSLNGADFPSEISTVLVSGNFVVTKMNVSQKIMKNLGKKSKKYGFRKI